MKNIFKSALGATALLLAAALTSCGEYEPRGYEEVPALPTVQNLQAALDNHTVKLSWQLPAGQNITDVLLITDAKTANPKSLGKDATSYDVVGQEWGVPVLYTVKVCYDDKYTSTGVTTSVTIPVVDYPGVNNLTAATSGRKVTLAWTLPDDMTDVTGIRITAPGASPVDLPKDATTYTYKAQPMDTPLEYNVALMHDTYYPSQLASVTVTIPYFESKVGYYMTAATPAGLPDDDEVAAATWFEQTFNASQPTGSGAFVTRDELATLDPDVVSVLWIEIDREGMPMGWENLPAEFNAPDVIDALLAYSQNGGSLYFSNHATQLTVPLGFVPDDMAPKVYGNGAGGVGSDVWTLMPYLGWMFRPGGPNEGQQGFYDRTDHAIFAGLPLEDPNSWGFNGIPLIGPGQREDHNCLWDCNLYGKGSSADVIANFESIVGGMVLATWGHVQDHCVAAMVDFYSSPVHGRAVAQGLAAYEWNQNSNPNIYQQNVEKLTYNTLMYLK